MSKEDVIHMFNFILIIKMKKNPNFIELLKGIKENLNSYEDLRNFFNENYPNNQKGYFKFNSSRSRYLITEEDFDFAIDSHNKFKRSSTKEDIQWLEDRKEQFLKDDYTQGDFCPTSFYDRLERDLLYSRKYRGETRSKIIEHIKERKKIIFANNPIQEEGYKNEYVNLLEVVVRDVFECVRRVEERLEELEKYDLDKEIDFLKEEN